MMRGMDAELVQRSKRQYADGLVEIVIWRVPIPIEPSLHRFKYRLVYVVAGVRVVGYDNERGKGDHRHSGALELPYQFVSLTSMLTDFWHDVERSGK
ncbi:MAG: DUF6516 family protein [Gallionella sp.]|nr:DUF6516 family protein [Gallionella sp.]